MIGPNLSEWALSKRSLVIFLMILSVIAGAMAFVNLGRNEDPAFTFRTMVVGAAWPGATVEETMEQVTERLERTLQETDFLDRIRSYTTAGQTTIFVDLKQSTPAAEVPDVWYQVRKNIGDMRGTLPAGVVGPGFNDDFGSTFGIIYAFTSDGFSFRELRDHVEAARSRLLQVPDVSKIEVLGAQDEQIFIEFDTQKLAGLRLDMPTILGALQSQNLILPSGVIQTERERVFLRVTGAFATEDEIADVNIVAGDRIFRIGDVATVRRGYSDPPQPMFRVNGEPAIGLAIAMRDSGDILALGENLRAEMAKITAELPQGIEPTLVADQAATVDVAIADFMTSLWQAIVIILACSFVALGVRPGTVVALSIPLTLAIVFAVMDIANIDLHRISLGALIIALGLLVDDAMTTVDAMVRRLGAGDTKDEAATFAYKTLAAPMLIGTLVTIASFVPIGFARSSAGEYTFTIFSVVGISLIVSWLVAVIFAPVVGKAMLKAPKPDADAKPGKLLEMYTALLKGAIKAKWLTIGLTLGAFVVALLLSSQVSRQFFPASDRPELTVDMTLRQNASIHATEAQAKRLEELLNDDPDVDHYSTYVGRGAVRFILTLNVQLANPFFAQFVIVAKDIDARERLQQKLEAALAEDFPEVVARVSPLELGPPVGWPLQYRVSGPDEDEVRRISLELAELIGSDGRVRHVNYDWMEPARLVEVGDTAAVFANPQHPYTQRLLASRPQRVVQPVAHDAAVLLDARDVDVTFPIAQGWFRKRHFQAVRQATLQLRRGETLGIVGESGSGKTTLGMALLALQDIAGGEVRLDAQRIDNADRAVLRAMRRRMQVVFQDPFASLSPRLTVGQIVGEGLGLHRPELSDREREALMLTMLDEVGLNERSGVAQVLQRYPHEFSGGQRQRIAIARAVVLRPEVLVLDEPTSALDVSVQQQVLGLLAELQRRYGMSYLFISHDLAVVRAMSHRVLVMKNGDVVEQGEAQALFDAPREAYTKELLAAAHLG